MLIVCLCPESYHWKLIPGYAAAFRRRNIEFFCISDTLPSDISLDEVLKLCPRKPSYIFHFESACWSRVMFFNFLPNCVGGGLTSALAMERRNRSHALKSDSCVSVLAAALLLAHGAAKAGSAIRCRRRHSRR